MKKYINVHIKIPEELFDIAYGILYDYKFTGIEEKFDEIIVTFEESNWDIDSKEKLIADLKKIDDKISIIHEEIITEKNWNKEWENKIAPNIISDKIVITPSWRINEIERELKIIINPKMSFGTGEHHSTKLICRAMENVVKPGQTWIDAGTGTGVLSILAVKLGAQKVYSFDNNEWAIQNALENFGLNNVANKIELMENSIEEIDLPKADGIAANLFINLILKMMNKFHYALKNNSGYLLVSGILIYDKDDVITKAAQCGFKLIQTLTEDEWICFSFKADGYE